MHLTSNLLLTGLLAAVVALAGCGGSSSSSHGGAATSGRTQAKPHHTPRPYPTLAVPAHVTPRAVRVPILTYHRVHAYATELTKSIPDLTVEPATFAAEIQALKRAGYHSITQRQLFDALYRGASLPQRPVLISVDDGYADDVKQILPVLRREHMVATFYVITGRFHEAGFLNPAQVRELDRAGMDVGDHTQTHANLPSLPPRLLKKEVAGSRKQLERVLGHPVYWFAYPYGTFDQRVVAELRRAGYLLAVTTQGGSTASSTAPLTIPRIHVGRAATAASVLELVRGGAPPPARAGSG